MFFGPIGKIRWPLWPLIGWDIFDFSESTERNMPKLDRKQELAILYHVCVFGADRKYKGGQPGLCLAETFSISLKPQKGICQNLIGCMNSVSSTKIVFFGPIGKIRWSPGLWFADIFYLFSDTADPNLQESNNSTSSTKFVFFGPIRKPRLPPWPLIGWDIFDFFSETAEGN